jgi:TolA-binding protein
MKDVGFGAEDVARINPLFVTYNSNGEVEGVKYDRLSAAFVNAFKEQQSQIEQQQTRIEQQQKLNENQQRLIESQQRQIDALKKLVCELKPTAEICKE